jgi:hypothetical protein
MPDLIVTYTHCQFQVFYTSASAMHGSRQAAAGGLGRVALPVKALKAGQQAYWLDQIARNREEYFSGRHPGCQMPSSPSWNRPCWRARRPMGFTGELWTLERIALVIERLTGVLRYHPAWV